MSVTETTTEGWGSRLMKSFLGVLVGLVFFFVSFPLLFWNEGRAVKTAKALNEGEEVCKTVESNAIVDPANNGQLVHMSGTTSTQDELSDASFGITYNGIRLQRKVGFYQWVEHEKTHTEKNTGGSTTTTTTYTYSKEWVDKPQDSSGYKESGHNNTVAVPDLMGKTELAKQVNFGAFHLNQDQIDRIGDASEYSLASYTIPAALAAKGEIQGNTLYIHMKEGVIEQPDSAQRVFPADAEVGDMRVTWQIIPAVTTISLIAVQNRDTFAPYVAKSSGYRVDLLADGEKSAAEMFQDARDENTVMTWILRFFGFHAMFIGLCLITAPLEVLADVLPILGGFVGALSKVACFVLALILSLITIAVAWVTYRPLIGISLLAVAVLLLILYIRKRKGKKAPADTPTEA